MADLIDVKFYGDSIQCVLEDGKLWVSVRRVSENLGLAPNGQSEKLKEKSWACSKNFLSHDASGREQRMFFLHIKALPMWLATIEEKKVNPSITQKLIRYQKEATGVLYDHFFGNQRAALAKFNVPTKLSEALALASRLEDEREREAERRRAAEQKIAEDEPKVEFAMAVKSSDNAMSFEEVSKSLANTGIKIGRNRLMAWLRDQKILIRSSNLPYQKYIDLGYFVVSPSTYQGKEHDKVAFTTRVTGRGFIWIEKRLRKTYHYNPMDKDPRRLPGYSPLPALPPHSGNGRVEFKGRA